jgi:PqqD family protein of HPr-rel-A system
LITKISSFPKKLRHEVVGQLHAVFDCVSGRSHFLTEESWVILSALHVPRTKAGHLDALKAEFDIEAEADVDQALNARIDELLRLGLVFPV